MNNGVLPRLRSLARASEDRLFLRVGGRVYAYGEAWAAVNAVARGLNELGVRPGDRVGIMSDNRIEAVWAWLGTNASGAIDVPFNADARGRLLSYFVGDAGPRVLIGTADYLEILAAAVAEPPEIAICIGPSATHPFGEPTQFLSFEELLELGKASSVELPKPAPGETATIMYTSGTTGASKGVMLPHGYYGVWGQKVAEVLGIKRGEVAYVAQPLFHIDARVFVLCALAAEATTALSQRFSVRNFWREVRDHNASVFNSIGTMLLLLAKQAPSKDDAVQPARRALCSSAPPNVLTEFQRRFDIEIVEAYGSTEALMVTHTEPGRTVPARVGRPIDEFDVVLVDDNDEPVPVGDIGELCVRPNLPHITMQGYWQKPDATVTAWRNLWFHTGDNLRRHEDGQFEYVGRKKDAIRRRGENISAWEVERAICSHEEILEAAAIGVASEVGEEDVAVLVVKRPDAELTPETIVEFVARDLPRFAIPRYVEFVDSLPKTPSERIAKDKVRKRGITDRAWDADS